MLEMRPQNQGIYIFKFEVKMFTTPKIGTSRRTTPGSQNTDNKIINFHSSRTSDIYSQIHENHVHYISEVNTTAQHGILR